MKTATKVGIALVVVAVGLGAYLLGPWRHPARRPAPVAGLAPDRAAPPPARPTAPAAAPSAGPSQPLALDDDPRGALRLEGVVMDAGERGVAGARVAIDTVPPREVATGRDGGFAFDGLIARDYRVEATTGDRYAGPVRLRLAADSEPVTLRLGPGGELAVVVTDRAGGAPIIGAAVELRATLTWTAVTGADGIATLRGVGPAWAPVTATAAGYAPGAVMAATTGDPAAPRRVAIVLGRGAAVAGRVVDEAGRPLAGVRVSAAPAADPFPLVDPRRDGVVSGADGRFVVPAVAAGSYRLTASDADHATATSSPFLVDGVSPRGGFELVLTAGGVVAGVVTDATGAPVPAATVRVVAAGHVVWRQRRQAFTDDAGRFALRGLPRRPVELVAFAGTGASAIATVDLAATAARRDLALVLDVTGAITGLVVDPTGVPVIDAQVIAEPQWSGGTADRAAWQVRGVPQVVTDSGGQFRFTGLPAGSYRVRAARPGGPERAAWQSPGVVAAAGATGLRLVLAADGQVTGQVALASGDAPDQFAIEANDAPALPFATADGRFAFTAPPGPLVVTVTGPGFVAQRVTATVEPGVATDLGTITVVAGRSVRGRVVDTTGSPIAGATVAAGTLLSGGGAELYLESESLGARTTQTDTDGRFTLTGFPPRALTVVAGKDGLGRAASVALPPSADSATLELVLLPVGGVDGHITRSGAPLADTIVIANPIGAVASNFFVTTGPDGSFAFDALTPGPYFVYPMIGGGGGRPKDMVMRTVDITAGARARLQIDASPGPAQLTVTIATDTHHPATMAMVVVVQATLDAPTMAALRDGSFLPAHLRDGAAIMMHLRMAMAGTTTIDSARPGPHTACAIVLPIGDDPSKASALLDQLDQLPMKCAPVTLTPGPTTIALTVPAAWTQPAP